MNRNSIPSGTGKRNSKGLKKLKNWIYAQRITSIKRGYFVLVRPVITYDLMDGLNVATLFPHDPLQEGDNVRLRVVNYILYVNGRPIRGISCREIFDTSIQLVRTCLVLNCDKEKKKKVL